MIAGLALLLWIALRPGNGGGALVDSDRAPAGAAVAPTEAASPRLRRKASDYLMRLRMFGATPAWVALTDEEKLAGRFLLRERATSPVRLARALNIGDAEARDRLAALAELGFAEPGAKARRLAPGHEAVLEGLGLNYHTVVLEEGYRFGVP